MNQVKIIYTLPTALSRSIFQAKFEKDCSRLLTELFDVSFQLFHAFTDDAARNPAGFNRPAGFVFVECPFIQIKFF